MAWPRRQILVILALLVPFFVHTGCNNRKSPPAPNSPIKTIFVKGDPRELVQGASFHPQSPFNESNIQSLNEFGLNTMLEFVERTPFIDDGSRDIQKEAKPVDQSKALAGTSELNLNVGPASNGIRTVSTANGKVHFDFHSEKNGEPGALQLFQVRANGETTPVEVLHWSTSSDGTMISVLIAGDSDESGRAIAAIYFERRGDLHLMPKVDSKYVYVAGYGIRLPLVNDQGQVQMEVCGSPAYKNEIAEAVAAWNDALKGRLNITLTNVTNYAPFSDLNHRCIRVINSYLSDPREDITNYGITFPLTSGVHGAIVDADIFVFKSEFGKISKFAAKKGIPSSRVDMKIEELRKMTFVHEMGHMLGLGHKFKENGETQGTPSVMSYDWKEALPTEYDRAAVQLLYPLRDDTGR